MYVRRIMFNRLDLLELFDYEKVTDKDVGATDYSLTSNSFTFTLSVWPIYENVFLTLSHEKQKFFIYEITLNNIDSIKVDRSIPNCIKMLFFEKNTKKSIATVMIKPEISLQCEFNRGKIC
jgi:hypothetical protein